MGKIICVRPPEELIIQFADGKEYKAVFNMNCLRNFQEMINKQGNIALTELSIVRLCCMILYAGINQHGEEISYEEAEALVANMNIQSVNEIVDTFTNEMQGNMKEEQKELVKKMMAQYLNKFVGK